LSIEPGCITAPNAASKVNAATVIAAAAIAMGTCARRPMRSASEVKITDHAATTTLRKRPGELLFCQGTAPVSIIAARSIPPKVKISLGSANLLHSVPTTKITNNNPPPSPSIR
jgi:hypothetical protein